MRQLFAYIRVSDPKQKTGVSLIEQRAIIERYAAGIGIGYLDCGKGKPKEIDPKKGPIVRRVFELYATGAYTLRDMAGEAERIGLRIRNGRPLRMQEIQKVLRNPFYSGIIRSKRFG